MSIHSPGDKEVHVSTSIDQAPARSATRDLAQIAVFAALIVVLGLPGQISIGSAGVPITLQTLGVMLAGALLGWRKGLLSVLAVIVIGLALPVLAGGRTTLTALASPTAGFLLGWLPAVVVIGLLTALMMPRYRLIPGLLINILGGIVVIYAFGVVGMLIRTELTLTAAIAANGVFVPGDLVKAVVTAVVAVQVHKARPGLIAPLRGQRPTPA
ncbi:BioY protein [Dietzia sp. DQ12-45-1b]|nr:BioY protein [Dietzia sp. DQ12-45-1b]